MLNIVIVSYCENYLFSHWLRVGDCCTEKAVPLESSVETGPVVVTVAGMGQAPGNECTELSVSRIARRLSICAGTHPSEVTTGRLAVLLVVV